LYFTRDEKARETKSSPFFSSTPDKDRDSTKHFTHLQALFFTSIFGSCGFCDQSGHDQLGFVTSFQKIHFFIVTSDQFFIIHLKKVVSKTGHKTNWSG
jgi:hypothetical protein